MRWRKWIAVGAGAADRAGGAGVAFRPDRAIRVATGVVAHNVCSKTFVSGLDPQTVFSRDHRARRPAPAAPAAAASSSIAPPGPSMPRSAGLFAQPRRVSRRARLRAAARIARALHSQERHRGAEDAEIAAAAGGDCRPDVVEPSDPALKAALDHAFEEPAEPPFRRTKAVVVVHDGKVIAERYAAGIGVDTPLLGFSMTKSVVNALIGDPDPAGPGHAFDAGADSGMARRSPPRDRGRASDAHDHGPGARRDQYRLRSRPARWSICTTTWRASRSTPR